MHSETPKLIILSFFVFISAIGASSPVAAPYSGKLGVEASNDAFVDIVRKNYRWQMPDGHKGWVAPTRDGVDEHGWPKSDCRWIADFRPCAEWAGQIDDPDAYRIDRSGTYKGAFNGMANLSVAGGNFSLVNLIYDDKTNRTTFDLVIPKPGPNHGLIVLQFSGTRRTPDAKAGSGISGFKLIRPGYAHDTRQIFTNEYLACLKSAAFSTIRFMGVANTNGNVEWGQVHTRLQAWSNRKLAEDAAVDAIEPLNKKDGWSWEYMIDLCDQTDMDFWINIPVAADDEYVRELALLVKARLKPSLNIYIEHSNEIWNFGFLQYAWNKARAKEEVAEGGGAYAFDKAKSEEIWAQRRHAQRVKDAVTIFAGVFGKKQINRRIRGVLAGVTPDPNGYFIVGRLPGMLDYLKATGSEPKDYIYAISIPAYYGGKAAAGSDGTEGYSVTQVLDDMRKAIDASKADRTAMVKLARRFELPGGFCAYESGPDIGGGRIENIGNRIRAVRDPRQADLYRMNFANCLWDLGGNLAMQFTLSGAYSRYGAWGLTDDVSKPDRNSLFQAVRDCVGRR